MVHNVRSTIVISLVFTLLMTACKPSPPSPPPSPPKLEAFIASVKAAEKSGADAPECAVPPGTDTWVFASDFSLSGQKSWTDLGIPLSSSEADRMERLNTMEDTLVIRISNGVVIETGYMGGAMWTYPSILVVTQNDRLCIIPSTRQNRGYISACPKKAIPAK